MPVLEASCYSKVQEIEFLPAAQLMGPKKRGNFILERLFFWRAISDSMERGFTAFDWGISWSGDKGLIKFKERWNGNSDTVYTYVYSMGSKPPVPGDYFNGFNFAKFVWKKTATACCGLGRRTSNPMDLLANLFIRLQLRGD